MANLFGNLTGAQMVFIPVPIAHNRVSALSLTRGLFSQVDLVSRTLPEVDCGPAVWCAANSSNCYYLALPGAGLQIQIRRDISSPVLLGALVTVAIGDRIRIESRFTASANDIRAYVNGALVDTVIDSSAGRPAGGGLYGIAFSGSDHGRAIFKNFSGGVL